MSKPDLEKKCDFLVEQVRGIGHEILVPRQGSALITIDAEKNLPAGARAEVTQAHCNVDDEAQEMFLLALYKRYPDARIIAEEMTETTKRFPPESDEAYISDLLDGTHLYGKGSPNFGSSVGYAYKGEMQIGVVYFPRHGLLFYAIRDKGAFIDCKKFTIEQILGFEKRDRICLNSKMSSEVQDALEKKGALIERPNCSIYGLSLVARNQAMAYIARHTTVWDVAPFSFILEEAGGIARRFDTTKIDFTTIRNIEDYIAAPNANYAKDVLNKGHLVKLS